MPLPIGKPRRPGDRGAPETTPLFAHVAGVPVEEMLPGVLACGAVGVRVATHSIRHRVGRRGKRRAKHRQARDEGLR